MSPRARRVVVRGVVQGVGFRPHVFRLAREHGVTGWVRNTSWGVEVIAEGEENALDRVVRAMRGEAPPQARIESLACEELAAQGFEEFTILASEAQASAYQLVSPDVATCADCRRELFDPRDRRYRYPFTNCTNCGPRFTIIDDLPYDRPATTMRAFVMCPACAREYDAPDDRRFHAQPNACPDCGPRLALVDAEGRTLAERDEALTHAVSLLREGRIVALKGLGGYQLACDATNAGAVTALRRRKGRPVKPFAVMLADLDHVAMHADANDAERTLLTSAAAPIVLLRRRAHAYLASADGAIVDDVAPGDRYLGVMLPYTPLHHLLARDAERPLVMTSGNRSEEPIARDNDEAVQRLRGIADAFLTHDRDVRSRYDDSVWFVPAGGPQPVRRARGYAPAPVALPKASPSILACGAQRKSTFCLTRDRYAFLSQHLGDLENAETLAHYADTLALYRRLFRIDPEIVAIDMHPDYASTRFGRALVREGRAPVAVQHHHAHLAACLADAAAGEGPLAPAIGVVWDGAGYGLDGAIWGGEFLVGDAAGFQRAAHLAYLPQPGGDAAVRRPYRLAYAYLRRLLERAPLPDSLAFIPPGERAVLDAMVSRGVNAPPTSSAGRLFDAVASLLGVCHEATFEGQAASALEMTAAGAPTALPAGPAFPDAYPYTVSHIAGVQRWGRVATPLEEHLEIGLAPLVGALLEDASRGVPLGALALQFHRTLAAMIVAVCNALRAATGLERVALSGGCFQNRLLLELVVPALRAHGFDIVMHRQVPCNDGGLAYGQAVIAQTAGHPPAAVSDARSVPASFAMDRF